MRDVAITHRRPCVTENKINLTVRLSGLSIIWAPMHFTYNIKAKFLKIQRKLFREQHKELSREEYEQMVSTARRQDKERLALLMETICATGIRVSEVSVLTVEAARQGRA